MLPQWVRTLPTGSAIHGIAINPATKWIIAYAHNFNPDKILILNPLGELKGAYSNADPAYYDVMMRNLLLGYDTATSTYTALIQTRSNSFGFTFSSSNSAPSFKWGFKSLITNPGFLGFSIMFASTEQYFYAYGR